MDYSIVESVNRHIQKTIKGLRVSGSFKRKEQQINELVYITKRKLEDVNIEFNLAYTIREIINEPTFISFWFETDFGSIKVNIYRVGDNYNYFYKCLYYDLYSDKIEKLKDMALKHNYCLNDNGLKNAIGQYIDIMNRKKLYSILQRTCPKN